METVSYIHWEEDDGWRIGYLADYPEYWTQGETLEDLIAHLEDLHLELTGRSATLDRRSPATSPLTEAQKRDLDCRLDLLSDDPKTGSPWEEVKARLMGHGG